MDVSFDFSSAGLIGSHAQLAVLFDASSVQNVYFQNDGRISLWAWSGTSGGYQGVDVGTFQNAEAFRFSIHIDAVQHQWAAYKDGVFLGGEAFYPDGPLNGIRFSYGVTSAGLSPDQSSAGIDNILVTVPEPGYLGSIGLMLAASLVLRRGKIYGSSTVL